MSGEFSGSVIVNVQNTDKVQLVLNNVSIKSEDGPAIFAMQSDKLFVTLKEGTINTLADSGTYSSQDSDQEPNAALFSKDDITINGTGSLTVIGNYMHGIVSKDDLAICNSNITVDSNNTAIRGKDELAITNSKIVAKAKTNGLDSNNNTDETKGNIIIENSSIDITSSGDGIQANNTVQITDTDIRAVVAGGVAEVPEVNSQGFDWEKRGPRPNDFITNSETTSTDDTPSTKGIKASKLLNIYGGTIEIDAYDDAVHSNGDVVLSPDILNIKTGDDGVHADNALYILSGNIAVLNSYEGLEAKCISIYDGIIDINSSDDGMNSSGGVDSSGMGGFGHVRPDKFLNANIAEDNDCFIKIYNGEIYVNANGDGIDSNGAISVFGGTTIIEGSENGGNGALDYYSKAEITGGTLIATGSSEMAVNFSATDNGQCISMINFKTTQNASSAIAVYDGSEEFILAFSPSKRYSSVIISTPEFRKNESYELKYNGMLINNGFTKTSTDYSQGTTYATLKFDTSILNINANNSHGGGMFKGR